MTKNTASGQTFAKEDIYKLINGGGHSPTLKHLPTKLPKIWVISLEI
jgi:hypothetical protein